MLMETPGSPGPLIRPRPTPLPQIKPLSPCLHYLCLPFLTSDPLWPDRLTSQEWLPLSSPLFPLCRCGATPGPEPGGLFGFSLPVCLPACLSATVCLPVCLSASVSVCHCVCLPESQVEFGLER